MGIRVGRLDGHDVRMSWEDVALIIMGPRSNKTSALAVPAVRAAPGLAVATSNKADLWALTSGSRAELGPVWVFDPQDIAYHPQQWWWDPLRAIREVPDPHRVEAATRLAGHFMATIGGTRRDPFFHAAGEQVLTGTLLAAALDPDASLREVVEWLQHGRRDAIIALDTAGAETEAADLHAALSGADVTAKGIFQTARTATKALTSQRILRWVTPPHTWREPGPDLPELDPWTVLDHTPSTLYLLSKEGAGTAAPVVAAIVDRLLDTAERNAQARGGRLDPPVVAVLDEAANICPIRELPQLYSHYGSRGIQVLTMLQSYQQGVGVWGNQGMDALWSAATIKLVGAGVDDQPFLARLSGLIGDHDVATTRHHPRPRTRPLTPVLHPSASRPRRVRPARPARRPGPCCCPPDARPGSSTCAPGTASPTPPTSPAAAPPHWPRSATPPPPPTSPPEENTREPTTRHTSTTPPTTWPACSPTCTPASMPSTPGAPTRATSSTNTSTAIPTPTATISTRTTISTVLSLGRG